MEFPLAISPARLRRRQSPVTRLLQSLPNRRHWIAYRAVELLRARWRAGRRYPASAGETVLPSRSPDADPRIAGVRFTGSTEVAKLDRKAACRDGGTRCQLIVETGGSNAMVVVIRPLFPNRRRCATFFASSFQSALHKAARRCASSTCSDVEKKVQEMPIGAMNELRLGNRGRFPLMSAR